MDEPTKRVERNVGSNQSDRLEIVMAEKILTQERLRKLLHYDLETGRFTWKIKPNRNIAIGSVAGSMRKDGYVLISIDGVRYYAHRLAWLYIVGEWPDYNIDHKDTSPKNNSWLNLRDATQSVNIQNQIQAHLGSATGVLGVHRDKSRFCAHIYFDGKQHHIGSYSSAEKAYEAYIEAKRKHHIGCTL